MSEQSTAGIERWTGQVHQGDAAEVLGELPEDSVHCVVTSPPYYGLRDYGADGQIGLEESLEDYIASIVGVAEEIKRVLRPDGSFWLNLGDTFAGSQNGRSMEGETKESQPPEGRPAPGSAPLPRKSKMLVPHRVAIALQEAGWIVRSDAVWSKPNPMPHPVKDRLHEHKEFLFHLTPEPDYWFDLDPIREPHKETSIGRGEASFRSSGSHSQASPNEDGDQESVTMDKEDALHPNGKNPGDVFEIAVKAFPAAHFAVYPPELCEAPIKSSCPPEVCAECGTPYEREIEETPLWEREPDDVERRQAVNALERFRESDLEVTHLHAARAVGFGDGDHGDASQRSKDRVSDEQRRLAEQAKEVLGGYFREFVASPERESAGWSQACDCETDETEPGVVLDPFAGAGTTLLVAKDLGRRFVGIDLNEEYVALAQKRVGLTVDQPELLLDDEDQQTLVAATDGSGASGPYTTGGDRP